MDLDFDAFETPTKKTTKASDGSTKKLEQGERVVDRKKVAMLTAMWSQNKDQWQGRLPLLPDDSGIKPGMVPPAKQHLCLMSWLDLIEISGGDCLITCIACASLSDTEISFDRPKISNFKKHHESTQHQNNVKTFMEVELGPTRPRDNQ